MGYPCGNLYTYNHCRAIKEVLACSKIEIDWKERGLSQVHQLDGLLMRWLGWCMVV